MILALTVGALAAIIIASAWQPRFHAGTLALACTLIIGTWAAGLSVESAAAFFPQSLFLSLLGVTLFSAFLDRSGLLGAVLTATVARLPQGRGRLAIATFLIIAAITALGLGNIAAVALVAPLAMPLARERGIPYSAMAVVVIGGANAAAFSPLAVAGILVGTYVTKHGLVARAGLPLEGLMLSLAGGVFVLMSIVTFLGFHFFSRPRKETHPAVSHVRRAELRGPQDASSEHASPSERSPGEKAAHGHPAHREPHGEPPHARKRLAFLVGLFIAALAFKVPLAVAGWSAAGAALLLTRVKIDDALKHVPFSSLLLVCGMSALVGLAESRELGALLAGYASGSINLHASAGVLSLLAGALSAFSSSTGVVLPLFLPIVDALAASTHVDGVGFVGTLMALMAGAHVVDASPFSTLGALCIAACPAGAARDSTFRALLAWGLAMIPVAGLFGLVVGVFL